MAPTAVACVVMGQESAVPIVVYKVRLGIHQPVVLEERARGQAPFDRRVDVLDGEDGVLLATSLNGAAIVHPPPTRVSPSAEGFKRYFMKLMNAQASVIQDLEPVAVGVLRHMEDAAHGERVVRVRVVHPLSLIHI